MRQIYRWMLVAFVSIVCCVMATGQNLRVTYSRTMDVSHPDLFKEAGVPEQYRSALINAYKDISYTYELVYVDSKSNFQLVPPAEKQELNFMGQKMDLTDAMKEEAKNVLYKNHVTGEEVQRTNFMGKVFLITGKLEATDYQIVSGEKKTIAGYECKKAVSEKDGATVWFTPLIPIKDGAVYTGLEGLVLEVSAKGFIYTATTVEEIPTAQLIIPQEGEKMSKADFQAMVEKRMKALQNRATE